MNIIKLTILFFLISMTFAVSAQDVKPALPIQAESQAEFDVKAANERFDRIALKLTTVNLQPDELNQAIFKLNALVGMAERCVDNSSQKINETDLKIKEYFGEGKTNERRADLNYLENQKRIDTKRQSECRLFVIRGKEALTAWRSAALSLQKEITLTKGDVLWERIEALPTALSELRMPAVIAEDKHFNAYRFIFAMGLLLITAFLIAAYLANKLHSPAKRRARHARRLALLLYLLFLCWLLNYYLAWGIYNLEVVPLMVTGIRSGVLVLSLMLLFSLLFSIKMVHRLLNWCGLNARFLYRMVVVILSLYFLNSISYQLLAAVQAPDILVSLFESLMVFLIVIATLFLSYRFFNLHRPLLSSFINKVLFMEILSFFSIAILMADLIGYHALARNAANIMAMFLLCGAGLVVILRAIETLYLYLHYSSESTTHLRNYFGYSSEPPYFEIVVLKWIAQFIIFVSMVFLFTRLIGEDGLYIHQVYDYFAQGFYIGAYQLNLLQWMVGISVFCVFILFSRHISARVSQRHQLEEEERQVALASIIHYVGISLALIIGLLVAGFSFTSLTIIAGALSVGIGLGLQSIVNNFVSGLILLIEKPIKAGDRIRINNIEGFVKTVQVRSTRLITPSKEDIIIPNSDLITQEVTNYTYSDKLWRVKCEVGVAYGSDTDLVSRLLMDVAMAHPEVVKSKKNQPLVFFVRFGDSALIFELWCLIRDVNKKYSVGSDLNMAIDKVFRANNISIAFPQRDVNLHIVKDKKPKDTNEP